MNTKTINAAQIHALLKLDDPAHFAIPEVREPDFVDPTTSTAVWIGADAAVELPTDLLARLPLLVHQSGWLARTKRLPGEFGITVSTHDAGYLHPAGGTPHYQTWRAVTDALEA